MWPIHVLGLTAALGQSATATLLPATGPAILASLDRRQVSGEEYQCHADCGYTILDAVLPDHCTNSTWTGMLEDCLDCALETDIWKDYGDSVEEAAQGCGVDATPHQPSSASSSVSPSSTGAALSSSTPTTASATSAVTPTSSATGGAQASDTPTPESDARAIYRDRFLTLAGIVIGVGLSFGLW